jgi:MtN3 and saliva related transmembrane protein
LPAYLGYIGGIFTTFCYVPQIMRVFRLKSAKEISLLFTVLLLTGAVIWLLYGIFLHLVPVILWNALGVGIVSVLLFAKLKYSRQQTRSREIDVNY